MLFEAYLDAQYQDLAIIETISPPFEDKFHSFLQKEGPNAHLLLYI